MNTRSLYFFRKSQGIWYYNKYTETVIYFLKDCGLFGLLGMPNKVKGKFTKNMIIVVLKKQPLFRNDYFAHRPQNT